MTVALLATLSFGAFSTTLKCVSKNADTDGDNTFNGQTEFVAVLKEKINSEGIRVAIRSNEPSRFGCPLSLGLTEQVEGYGADEGRKFNTHRVYRLSNKFMGLCMYGVHSDYYRKACLVQPEKKDSNSFSIGNLHI